MRSRPIVERDERDCVYRLHLTAADLVALGAVSTHTFTAAVPCPEGLRLDAWHVVTTTGFVLTGDDSNWVLNAEIGVVGNTVAICTGAGLGGIGNSIVNGAQTGAAPTGSGSGGSYAVGTDLGGDTIAIRVSVADTSEMATPTLDLVSAGDATIEVLASPRAVITIPAA